MEINVIFADEEIVKATEIIGEVRRSVGKNVKDGNYYNAIISNRKIFEKWMYGECLGLLPDVLLSYLMDGFAAE